MVSEFANAYLLFDFVENWLEPYFPIIWRDRFGSNQVKGLGANEEHKKHPAELGVFYLAQQ